jgi:hypothetical protein
MYLCLLRSWTTTPRVTSDMGNLWRCVRQKSSSIRLATRASASIERARVDDAVDWASHALLLDNCSGGYSGHGGHHCRVGRPPVLAHCLRGRAPDSLETPRAARALLCAGETAKTATRTKQPPPAAAALDVEKGSCSVGDGYRLFTTDTGISMAMVRLRAMGGYLRLCLTTIIA